MSSTDIKILKKQDEEFNPKSIAEATEYLRMFRNELHKNTKTALDAVFRELSYSTIPTEFVDLGLPSGKLWSSKNIGALKIADGGDLYQNVQLLPLKYQTEYSLYTSYTLFDNLDYTKIKNRYENGDNSIGSIVEPTQQGGASRTPNRIKGSGRNDYLNLVPYGRGYIYKNESTTAISTNYNNFTIVDTNNNTMGSDILETGNMGSIATNGTISNFMSNLIYGGTYEKENDFANTVFIYWNDETNKWSVNGCTVNEQKWSLNKSFDKYYHDFMYYEAADPLPVFGQIPLVSNGTVKDIYDIVSNTYDGHACIPTTADVNELINNTTQHINFELKQVKFKSRYNDNYIVLPMIYNNTKEGYDCCSLMWIKEGTWVDDSPNDFYAQVCYLEIKYKDSNNYSIGVVGCRDVVAKKMVSAYRGVYDPSTIDEDEYKPLKEKVDELTSKVRYIEEITSESITHVKSLYDYKQVEDNTYVELGWSDGGTNDGRLHRFVKLDGDGVALCESVDDEVIGVTVEGTFGSIAKVKVIGVVDVDSSGRCYVGNSVIPTTDGKAVNSSDNKVGYRVLKLGTNSVNILL